MKFLLQSETKNNGRVFWRKGWIIGQKRRTWNDQDAERGTKEATRTLPPIGGAQKRRCSVSLAATRANAVVIRAASVSVRRFPRNIQSATFYSSSKHGRANIQLVLWISSKFLSHSCSVEGLKKSEVEGQGRNWKKETLDSWKFEEVGSWRSRARVIWFWEKTVARTGKTKKLLYCFLRILPKTF